MKKNSNIVLSLKEKKALLEKIEDMVHSLEQDRVYYGQDYRSIGKSDKQATSWKTKELLWEDEEKTIPKYEDIYGYVDKEELDDDDKAKIKAVDTIIEALLKLV